MFDWVEILQCFEQSGEIKRNGNEKTGCEKERSLLKTGDRSLSGKYLKPTRRGNTLGEVAHPAK